MRLIYKEDLRIGIRNRLSRVKKNLIYDYQTKIKKMYRMVGYEYINKEMKQTQYKELCNALYGNQYLKDKYMDSTELQIEVKRWIVDVILYALGTENIHSMCDAGANRGYLMAAFNEKSIESYGFDILDNKELVIGGQDGFIAKNYKIASIVNGVNFNRVFDLVTCIDVVEHIPVNYSSKMAQTLKNLGAKYIVLQVSCDQLNDGHITLKGTKYWKKLFEPEYHIMKELNPKLNKICTMQGIPYWETGIPANGFNQAPGIIFLEKS